VSYQLARKAGWGKGRRGRRGREEGAQVLVARNALGAENREELLGCHELLLQSVRAPGFVQHFCLYRGARARAVGGGGGEAGVRHGKRLVTDVELASAGACVCVCVLRERATHAVCKQGSERALEAFAPSAAISRGISQRRNHPRASTPASQRARRTRVGRADAHDWHVGILHVRAHAPRVTLHEASQPRHTS